MSTVKSYLTALCMLAGISGQTVIAADISTVELEVTITNISHGETFTPFLIATHRPGVTLFETGAPASAELAALAEGGDTAPLAEVLAAMPEVHDIVQGDSLLEPGQSITFMIQADHGFNHVSAAAMLIPTNDAFVALNDVRGTARPTTVVYQAPAYDAGSEPNDELCVNIPGPVCGGTGPSPDEGGEGFVHMHPGIHGIGDLTDAEFDWRGPVAEITIRRPRF